MKRTTTTLRNRGRLSQGFRFRPGKQSEAVQLLRHTTTFSLRRTLSCYSLVKAFKDARNLHHISYNDGLIDDGEFIVLYDLDYWILEAFSSSRNFQVSFVLKLKVIPISKSSWLAVTLNFGCWREFSAAVHLLLFITRKYAFICVKRRPTARRFIH